MNAPRKVSLSGSIRPWIVQTVRAAGWAPLIVFLVHAVISRTGIYRTYPWLDIPMHLVGGVAIAYFFDRCLAFAVEAGLVGQPSRTLLVALVFTSTCTAAVFWELAEWSLDLYFESEEKLGLEDTFLDMVRGILGGSLYLVVSNVLSYRRADPD